MDNETMKLYSSFSDRIHYVFREFDNVLIAISASAESTLLLELTYRIWSEHYRSRSVCVFNIDTEIAHSYSVLHLMESFEHIKNDMFPLWIMLPTRIKHNLFGREEALLAWDDSVEKCLRPIPDLPYVINIKSDTAIPYRRGMPARTLTSSFLKWYKQSCEGGRTACLNGARLEEPHNRERLLYSKKRYKGNEWIYLDTPEIWQAAPLYDQSLSAVWKALYDLKSGYNKIYDLLYKRGDGLESFRITPQLNYQCYKELRRFAELDGIIWDDLCRRIKGIEIYSTYSDPRPLFDEINEKEHITENRYEKSCI